MILFSFQRCNSRYGWEQKEKYTTAEWKQHAKILGERRDLQTKPFHSSFIVKFTKKKYSKVTDALKKCRNKFITDLKHRSQL